MTKHLTPAVRIQKARTALLLDHPFFGSLLFRLGGRVTGSIPTMATDGVSLFYNPAFVETLNAAELAGVLAHECMHPALQHHTRRGDRDRKRWNMACDYAINPLPLDAGLTLLKDVLIEHRFRGMSAERIYNLIEEQQGERALLPVVGQAQYCAADAGFSHRPVRRIPGRGACLPSVVGLHGVAPGTIRASDSDGSGLAPLPNSQLAQPRAGVWPSRPI
jgi:Putative metallopeptidase domain